MKSKFLSLSLSLLLLQPALAVSTPSGILNTDSNKKPAFTKIVFFGDSLSDNGNLYRDLLGFIPKNPPYFEGRFSNGQVWSEYVAQYFYAKNLIETSNYAIGGQTAFLHNPIEGYLPYTLAMSRVNYILHSVLTDRSSTLFVIWVGANDYLPGIKNIDALTSDVVNSIKSTIEDLIYYGGVNFLILNLPNLSSTPFGRASDYAEALNSATIVHNLKLDQMVTSVQDGYKKINIHLYDINQFFNSALENPDEYNKRYHVHITNVTDACWKGRYTIKSTNVNELSIAEQLNHYNRSYLKSTLLKNENSSVGSHSDEIAHFISRSPALLEAMNVEADKQAGAQPCINPDEYIFWDKVHPGSVPHKVIGQELIAFIDNHFSYGKESV